MTEFERMRDGEPYDYRDGEIHASLSHAKRACARLAGMSIVDAGYREAIEDLIPGIPGDSTVCPPFFCDHGNGIAIGHGVFVNYGCTMLDSARITIGDHVLIGPNCQLYTPEHPMDHMERRKSVESARPVTIGNDTWLCGGVTVCPGVRIGQRCVIGAGSVVTRDIPDDCMAAGNPARVRKRLL